MKKIKIQEGVFAIVDDDFDHKARWRLDKDGYAVYGKRINGIYHTIRMHHIVLGKPNKGRVTDHINQDKLDNRKANLRVVNRSINNVNKPLQKNSTCGLRGVTYSKRNKLWYAQLRCKKKYYWGGYHLTKEEASKAYNLMASKIFGVFARLNDV